ncbi:MAG: DUF4366 domain-containing protein [Lachnospiraceae bacterium]|nr:DUF4366 domain-containing protein [Lachnospiraceae bacterium]
MGRYDWSKVEAALKQVNTVKGNLTDLIDKHKEAQVEEEIEAQKKNTILIVLAIVGCVVLVAGIVFALWKYFTPDYYEDYEDDYDDRFDDDFFEDEDSDDFVKEADLEKPEK